MRITKDGHTGWKTHRKKFCSSKIIDPSYFEPVLSDSYGIHDFEAHGDRDHDEDDG